MARFKGIFNNNITRLGHAKTGICCTLNGWECGVRVRGFVDENGFDAFSVYATSGSNGRESDKHIGTVKREPGILRFVTQAQAEHAQPASEVFASLIGAIANCEKEDESIWYVKHGVSLRALAEHVLPSGSGFDCGSRINPEESNSKKLVFHTSYHHMNESGYVGWTEHDVIVKPSFAGLDIRVTGQNRNDIKDYVAECFDSALRTLVYQDRESGRWFSIQE